jgi:hypothetical protein
MRTATTQWQDLLSFPDSQDHFVQVYQDDAFLVDAVAAYVGTGFRQDEAAIIIARPEHRALFEAELARRGCNVQALIEKGQLKFFDAVDTLALFMRGGMPDWRAFHEAIGGVIAEVRLKHPGVRAYGEMVDILWHEGRQDAAIRLEEFWNQLIALQTFSLFCAYRMDNLASEAYGGPLQCICKVHSHLIPARDYAAFNKSVIDASQSVLGKPLAKVLGAISAQAARGTQMPEGQAALLWLKEKMPCTAEKVLDKLRAV